MTTVTVLEVPTLQDFITDPGGRLSLRGERVISEWMRRVATELEAVKTRATTLEADLATAEEEIETLQDDLTALTTRVTAAEGEIETLQTELDAAEVTIADHETRITALEP